MDQGDRPSRERPKTKGRDAKLFIFAMVATVVLVILMQALAADAPWAIPVVLAIAGVIGYLIYRAKKNKREQE